MTKTEKKLNELLVGFFAVADEEAIEDLYHIMDGVKEFCLKHGIVYATRDHLKCPQCEAEDK